MAPKVKKSRFISKSRNRGKKTLLHNLLRLNYLKPRISPHGLSGMFQLSLGCILLKRALNGDLSGFENGSILLILYWCASIFMSIGAIFILKQAEPKFRFVFKYTALIQLILVYFAYRFSVYHQPQNLSINTLNLNLEVSLTKWIDFVFGSSYMILVALMITYSYINLGIAACSCFTTLLTIMGYIVPITLYSQEYVDCVSSEFPAQNIGFVAYVFTAITTILSFCMFCVTLVNRKMIDSTTAVPIFIIPVFGIIISTVLMQELVIPYVSTQRLIIFCPRPEHGSYSDHIESYFNISTLAQLSLESIGVMTFHHSQSHSL